MWRATAASSYSTSPAHRADIDDGEHQQQPQPFRAGDGAGEIEDGLEVGQVALERGVRHQQMVADQP